VELISDKSQYPHLCIYPARTRMDAKKGGEHDVSTTRSLSGFSGALLRTLGASAQIAHFSAADHSKFKELQGPFSSGPEAAMARLTRHVASAVLQAPRLINFNIM
jgi:hypothetical protein